MVLRLRHPVLVIVCLLAPLGLFGKKKDDSRPELVSPKPTISTSGDALEDVRKKAAQGDAQANYEMGERLLRGDGAPADARKARQYLEKAADAGSAEAAFRLGKLSEEGTHTPQDLGKAFSYYHRAAVRGLPTAQYNVGAMYASGRGVPRNFEEGLAWLILASRNGADPDGENQLRAHLHQTHRDSLIVTAEARAKVLATDPGSPPLASGATEANGATVPRAAVSRPTLPRPEAPSHVDVNTPSMPPGSTPTPPAVAPLPAGKMIVAPTPTPPPAAGDTN